MALTPEQIDLLIQQADGLAPKEGSIFRVLVKLTEAEVRKQDDALILQLVEALERSSPHTDHEYRFKPEDWMKRRAEAIQAGRARLEGKT